MRCIFVSIIPAVFLAFGATPEQAGGAAAAGYSYLSPVPGARFVLPSTHVLIRPGADSDPAWMSAARVTGSVSGVHGGHWKRSGATWIFAPGRAFSPGEIVSVSLPAKGGATFDYEFEVCRCRPAPRSADEKVACLRSADDGDTGASRSAALVRPGAGPAHATAGGALPPVFPFVEVTVSDSPEDGLLFLSNFAFDDSIDTPFNLMILDNAGAPVFFRPLDNAAVDFKKQDNGLLTYFNLSYDYFDAMDSTYTVVDSFAAGNGYTADFHDLQILPDGHALLMIYDAQFVDMSAVVPGGDPNAEVIGLVVQELDAEGQVVFQWRSWDHMDITDSSIDLTTQSVDYVHGNALDLDDDGNILLSSRHIDEITKINRTTGDIMWRLGGIHNQFTLLNDTMWFSRQHDVRRLPNGHITLFDNGNVVRRSRGIEYAIDENAMTITRVWEHVHAMGIWGYAMGSVQRLEGGNTLIGWGAANPSLTEVHPDGTVALELSLAPGVFSYRAFRFSWQGKATKPYLWGSATPETAHLGFRKFGDDAVERFYVYQGSNPQTLSVVDSTTADTLDVSGLTPGATYYFRVTAWTSGTGESPASNTVSLTMDSQTPVLISRFDARAVSAGVMMEWELDDAANVSAVGPFRGNRPDGPFVSLATPLAPAVRSYLDDTAGRGRRYWYRLRVIEDGNALWSPAVAVEVPEFSTLLGRNYPNPFNPATVIPYAVGTRTHVTIDIYDVEGRLVRRLVSGIRDPGEYEARWDGRTEQGNAAGSGVYLCCLKAGTRVQSRTMVLLK